MFPSSINPSLCSIFESPLLKSELSDEISLVKAVSRKLKISLSMIGLSGFLVKFSTFSSKINIFEYFPRPAGQATTLITDVKAIKLIKLHINIVRRCLLWTSVEDECFKKVGRDLNSSAITKTDEAIKINVVKKREISRMVQLKWIID